MAWVNRASPLYCAVIECDPTARLDTDRDACPETKLELPRELVPSKKVIVPEAGGTAADDPLTTAVKVTVCESGAGFNELLRLTMLGIFVTRSAVESASAL